MLDWLLRGFAAVRQRANRVWALGRDTYVRLYPNPGIGLGGRRVGWRLTVSLQRGFEVFKATAGGEWALRCRYFNRKLAGKAWGS